MAIDAIVAVTVTTPQGIEVISVNTPASGYSGYSGSAATSSGYSGYSGYCGKSGYSGYSGLGVPGLSGYSGASGYSGYSAVSPGPSGYSGYSGRSGYSGTPSIAQNVQNADYEFALGDNGGQVYHSDGTPRAYTIPYSGAVAFPIGAVITIVNDTGAANITLDITTDTLQRGDGTAGTGPRTIGPDSIATVLKITSTTWMIIGAFS